MEFTTFRHKLKWLLTVVVNSTDIIVVATAFWSHTEGKWVDSVEVGTVFETEAAALVYRRGNLSRMTSALKDISI